VHYEASFKKWLEIFETFPEGVSMVHEDGQVSFTNKSMRKLLEHPAEEKRRV